MTAPMSHDEIQELLGAFALDAVDGDERELVELHLHECPRCWAEVVEHREVAALLGHGGAPAPDGLWDRILESLEETPPVLRLPVPAMDARPIRRGRAGGFATAAALVAAAISVVLGVQVVRQQREIDRIEAAFPAEAALLALADSSRREADLVSPDGTVRIKAVASEEGQGYLFAHGLPSLSEGRIYQLWGVSGEEVISLGVLGSDPSVVAFPVDEHIGQLAITAEAAPVEASENPAVVAGELS